MKRFFRILIVLICVISFLGCGNSGKKELEEFNSVYNDTFNVINNSFNNESGIPLDNSVSDLYINLNDGKNNILSKNEWQNTSSNIIDSHDKIAKGIITFCLDFKGDDEVLGKVWKLSNSDSNIVGKVDLIDGGYVCKYIENDTVYNMITCTKYNGGVKYEVIISYDNNISYFNIDNHSNGIFLSKNNYVYVYSSVDSIGYISNDQNIINNYINSVDNIKNITSIKSELSKVEIKHDLNEFIDYVGINQSVEWVINNGVLYAYNGTDSVITIPSEVHTISYDLVLSSTVEKLIIPSSVKAIENNNIDEFSIFIENNNRLKEIEAENSLLFKVIDGNLYTKDGDTLLYITDSLNNVLDLRCNNIRPILNREAIIKSLSNVKEIYLNSNSLEEIHRFFDYIFRCNELNGNKDIILNKVVIEDYTSGKHLYFSCLDTFKFEINTLELKGNYTEVKIDDSTLMDEETYGVIKNIEISENAKIVIGSKLSGITSLVINQNGEYGFFDNLQTLVIEEGVTDLFFDTIMLKNSCVIEVPSTIEDFNVNMFYGKENLTIKVPFTQNVFERLGLYNNLHMTNYEVENHIWYGGNIEFANDNESLLLDEAFPIFEVNVENEIIINGYFGDSNVINVPDTLYGKKVNKFILSNKVYDGRDYLFVNKFDFDKVILPKSLKHFSIECEDIRFNIDKITFNGTLDEFIGTLGDESLLNYVYSFVNQIICNEILIDKPINNSIYIYNIDGNEFKLFADFDSKSYAFEFDYNGKLYKSHIINRDNYGFDLNLYDENISVHMQVSDQNLPYSINSVYINIDGREYRDFDYRSESFEGNITHDYIEYKEENISCGEEIKVYEKCETCNEIGNVIRIEKSEDHTYESTHVEANCSNYEHILYTCTKCGHNYQEVLGNTIGDHKFTEYDVKQPTCNKDGFYMLQCEFCYGLFEGEVIPKTGEHNYNEDGLCTECYENHKLFLFGNSSIFDVKDTSLTELVIPSSITTTITYFQLSSKLPNLKKIIVEADLEDFVIIESDEVILPNLEEIVIKSSNSKLIVKDGVLYNKETLEMLYVPYRLSGEVDILDGVKSIKRFDGRDLITKITIPESVTNMEVYSFKDCTNLKEAVINANITELKDKMFFNCTSLSKVTLPKTLEVISTDAFSNTAIEVIDLPKSVKSFDIGFNNCESLKQLNIDSESPYFYIDNSIVYSKSSLNIVFVNPGFDGNLDIPEGSKSIPSGIEKLDVKKIIIPNTVTSIIYNTFANMNVLEELVVKTESKIESYGGMITLPSSVKKISVSAENLMVFDIKDVYEITVTSGSVIDYGYNYEKYSNAKILNLPNSIKVFNSYIFDELTEINYEGTINDWMSVVLKSNISFNVMSFGGKKYTGEITFTGEYFNGGILENTDGITAVILPNAKEIVNFNVSIDKLVAPNADKIEFYGGASVKELHVKTSVLPSVFNSNVPSYVEKLVITSGEILECDSISSYISLVELELSDSIKIIKDGAIFNINLDTIDLPSNLEVIESNAISFCENLKTININSNCVNIEPGFVYWCPNVNTVNINNNQYFSLDNNILYNKDYSKLIYVPAGLELESYKVNDKVTEISEFVFYGTKIKEVILPNDISKIGAMSFSNSSIEKINIPEKVSEIEDSAFYYCEALEEVKFVENSILTKIGEFAFSDCVSLKELLIPDSVQTIGKNAFTSCSSLKRLKFPSSYIPDENYRTLCDRGQLFDEVTIPTCLFGELKSTKCIINSGNVIEYSLDMKSYSFIKKLVVCENVETIEKGAFIYLKNLEYLSLPMGGDIGKMFESSLNMFPETLKTLEFTNKEIINEVTLHCYNSKIETLILNGIINNISFNGSNVNKVYYNGDINNVLHTGVSGVYNSDIEIYLNDELLTEVYINDTTYIADGVLSNCKHLDYVEVGAQVERVGKNFLTNAKLNQLIVNNHYDYTGDTLTRFANTEVNYCKLPVSLFNTSNITINEKLELFGINEKTTLNQKLYDGKIAIIDESVTDFASSVFYNWKNIQDLTIPFIGTNISSPKELSYLFGMGSSSSKNETLETIKITNATELYRNCFNRFTNLTTVNLNSGLTVLNNELFVGTKVETITLPDTVTTFNGNPFYNAMSMKEILVDSNNTQFKSVDGVLYNYECTKLIVFPAGKEMIDKNYDILESVKTINSYAFGACDKLIGVNLPKKLEKIEDSAFYGCTSIVSLYIYKGDISIDSRAFSNTSIVVFNENPESAYNEHSYIEYDYKPNETGVYKNTYVKVINNVRYFIINNYGYVLKQSNLLSGDIKLSSHFFVNNQQVNVTRIVDYAFKNTKVTSITFDIDIEDFSNVNPFAECDTLKEFKVTNYCYKLRTINGILFDGDSLVAYPNGKEDPSYILDDTEFTFIRPYAFKGCNNLERVIVNNPNKWYYKTENGFYEPIGVETLSNPINARDYLVNNTVELKLIKE